jgi:hypothetical protein
MERRNCTRCTGTGILDTTYGGCQRKCFRCDGVGTFPAPDIEAILHVLTKKGKEGRRVWKASRPHHKHGTRPYYVWRLARFHGGKDVTLPMGAMLDIAGDPYEKDLQAIAEAVANKVFGSAERGRARWHYAMTGKIIDGFVDGPTYDEHKPRHEYEETK